MGGATGENGTRGRTAQGTSQMGTEQTSTGGPPAPKHGRATRTRSSLPNGTTEPTLQRRAQ